MADTNFRFILTVIRHGESQANKEGLIQGQLESSLTDDGQRQAALLGRRLASEHVTHVYSSDLIRAKNTADIALKEVKPVLRIVEDARLRERCLGVAQGEPVADHMQKAASFGLPAYIYTPPGAESYCAVEERVNDFFVSLCQNVAMDRSRLTPIPSSVLLHSSSSVPPPIASVLVFTHSALIRILLRLLSVKYGCQVPENLFIICPNTSLSVFNVSCQADGTCEEVTCHRMFCVQHLELCVNHVPQ